MQLCIDRTARREIILQRHRKILESSVPVHPNDSVFAAITAKVSAIEFRLSKPAFRPVAPRVSQLLSRQRPLRSKFDPRPVTKLIKTDGQN